MDDRNDLDFLDDRKILQKILSISFHDNREENLTRRFVCSNLKSENQATEPIQNFKPEIAIF